MIYKRRKMVNKIEKGRMTVRVKVRERGCERGERKFGGERKRDGKNEERGGEQNTQSCNAILFKSNTIRNSRSHPFTLNSRHPSVGVI